MKVSKNFIIQEFVPKEIYTKWGNKSIYFIDERIISIAQFFRDRFEKVVTINNWFFDNGFENRGYRTPNSTVGGKLSQHRFGRAIDFNINGYSSQEIYNDIIKNEKIYIDNHITTIENIAFTPTWIHVDCRWTNSNKLLIVNP